MPRHFSCLILFLLALPLRAQMPSSAQPPTQDRLVQLLKELTEAPGPPGYEEAVRKLFTDRIKPFADSVAYDGLGSVIAQQGNSGPRIMLDAHMDELGGMVRRIRPDGFISMQMLGYWLSAALPDQRWVILGSKGPVLAVTDIWDAHIAPHDAQGHVQQQDLYLDTGARSAAEDAALGITLGDPVVPVSDFAVLANNRYLAKAWDDRVGCAVMLEVARRLAKTPHPNQVFYAATVQEEGSIEMRGAQTSARIINPDVGFSLEVGIPNDVPGPGPDAAQEVLGGGPGLMLYTFSELPNRKLSIIDRADFDRTVDLVVALIHSLDAATIARIKTFNLQ